LPGRRGHVGAFVLPARRFVLAGVRVETGEQPVQVLGIAEVLAQDHRRIGVGHDVLAEPQVVLQHVPDQAAEERDVTARA